jgi:AraC-like DNA-binding protein
MGLSSRTLSRKLGEEETSFAEILDQSRAALAKRYLEQQQLPVSEVAWLLGYRELSSLLHAFKRWPGMTQDSSGSGGLNRAEQSHPLTRGVTLNA